MKILKYIITLFFIKVSMAGTFSELRGMEDSLGNTHLFYRIYQVFPGIYGDGCDNSVYHFDLSNSLDTLFLVDYAEPDYFPPPLHGGGNVVLDYKFWNQDPGQFIYCGFSWGTDIGSGYIRGYNPEVRYWYYGSPMAAVEISKQNDSLLFASNTGILFKSTDGGYTWEEYNSLSWNFRLINLSPFNDSIIFTIIDSHISKSIDGGLNFTLVDSMMFHGNNFYFDMDRRHIYGVSGYDFFRSLDFGNSWEIIYSDTASLNISIDPFTSGQIYLSRHNQILLSNDFGDTFQLIYELDDPIIGLYKKPMFNKIYAATPSDICEIDSTGIFLIKHLTPIENEENIEVIPTHYELEQNFPNPFNSSTTICFKVKKAGQIKIILFDLTGQEIDVLFDRHRTPGDYHFQWEAHNLASGIYFYSLIVNDRSVSTRKMVLLK
jgi:hypothetical protein